jgi:transcriptional regulator with XRE-family HTH domain
VFPLGIGLKLKTLIENQGTNVNEVATATGVSPQTIYSIIKRDSEKASISDLGKVAWHLGVDLNYFYAERHKKNPAAEDGDGLTDREHAVALAYRVASEDDRIIVDAALKKYLEPQQKYISSEAV